MFIHSPFFILTDSGSIRTTQFNASTQYNIEDINFYIPVRKANENQVFLVLKNNKNLYEIVELMPKKDGASSTSILYKMPLKQALRINNESVVLKFLLININTGEYTYSSSMNINIETDNFRIAQQVYVAQQVNFQTQDLYKKMVRLAAQIEELYNDREEIQQ